MSNVVIIPVHNQLHLLKRCIDSVIAKTNDLKLIVVDDGSTDKETSEWIENNYPLFDVIKHETAQGFSKACNDGIRYALDNYDFTCLCLLNSDTVIVTDDWFDKVRWYFENGENVGIASVMSDNALAQTVKDPQTYMSKIDKKPAVYSYLLHGFCYFIRRELIEKIGMLDEVEFPHYGSEDDYSLKSLKEGWKNLLVGSVFVHHDNAQSYSQAQRTKIVAKSYPALIKRWGRAIVNRTGTMSVRAGEYVNKH